MGDKSPKDKERQKKQGAAQKSQQKSGGAAKPQGSGKPGKGGK
jgi:hypothetical protein